MLHKIWNENHIDASKILYSGGGAITWLVCIRNIIFYNKKKHLILREENLALGLEREIQINFDSLSSSHSRLRLALIPNSSSLQQISIVIRATHLLAFAIIFCSEDWFTIQLIRCLVVHRKSLIEALFKFSSILRVKFSRRTQELKPQLMLLLLQFILGPA